MMVIAIRILSDGLHRRRFVLIMAWPFARTGRERSITILAQLCGSWPGTGLGVGRGGGASSYGPWGDAYDCGPPGVA